jgi:hypothetical protein
VNKRERRDADVGKRRICKPVVCRRSVVIEVVTRGKGGSLLLSQVSAVNKGNKVRLAVDSSIAPLSASVT